MMRYLPGDGASKSNYCSFGCSVNSVVDLSNGSRDRPHVDDSAAWLLYHDRKYVFAEKEDAAEIDIDDPPEIGPRNLFQRFHHNGAGVIDERINTTVPSHHLIHERLDIALV